jgi:hypothetical protein
MEITSTISLILTPISNSQKDLNMYHSKIGTFSRFQKIHIVKCPNSSMLKGSLNNLKEESGNLSGKMSGKRGSSLGRTKKSHE